MKKINQIISLLLSFVLAISLISSPFVAYADGVPWSDSGVIGTLIEFIGGSVGFDKVFGTNYSGQFGPNEVSGKNYSSSKPQNYYTTCTSSTQDQYGNVTNYYRGGDTTNTSIIDSYNHTFNTIHNTTNNTTTNNYKANVRLSDFLNNYTTNNITNTTNNQYTYSADFKSWYYDNTTNNYNYVQHTTNNYNQENNYTYYNTDNSRYYISIDNSKDEYYLVDVQYSPTFVTVNYTYNTTNNKYDSDVGDVTNVYYYELKDGRNSSTLTASEVAGLDVGYDVANYELVTDDPNTLSLQHFDTDYSDSSSYNRTFYSQNRSTSFVDSGAFGKAVSLPNGSAAGVTIPGLSGYSSLSFDFRIYYSDISKLGIYFGDTNLFQEVPTQRIWKGKDIYSDDGSSLKTSYTSTRGSPGTFSSWPLSKSFANGVYQFSDLVGYAVHSAVAYPDSPSSRYTDTFTIPTLSSSLSSQMTIPSSYSSPGYEGGASQKYGWMAFSNAAPSLYFSTTYSTVQVTGCRYTDFYSPAFYYVTGKINHYTEKEYRWSPSKYVVADFSYDSYKNQWVSMRITISGSRIYYFVNGDLVGSGSFTKPTADKFYIKSGGGIYLDELRVTTGSLSSTGTYNPATAPYDTNKVLALPDTLVANTIYVQHTTPVTICRVGGVRPSNPSNGFLYIPLHSDYTGAQPQLYTDGNWIDVTAVVYDGSTTTNAVGFQFSPVGSSPDVDVDLEPGRPSKPGDGDPDTCKHNWEETSRTDASCSLPGSVTYTCSKCESAKSETLPKLGHTWEIKQTVQTSYDENGNILTQGFTIYRCSACGEEYKDTDGAGPPVQETPGAPGEDGDGTLWDKIGEFFGSIFGGLLDLISAVLDGILGGLIDLVTNTLNRLKELVDIFGSFGEALGVLWTWLPPEIMAVLVAGVTVFVFIALLKLFMK